MKILYPKYLFCISYFILFWQASSFAYTKKKSVHTEPLFQISGGYVYSSIDLSMYNNSINYRGFHTRLVTHVTNVFFLSAEYSSFPGHSDLPVWMNISTRKMDMNGQLSFMTNSQFTHIYVLAGIDRHEWKGQRTVYSDPYQPFIAAQAGDVLSIVRFGINAGCGFTQTLYENIGLFGDFRFVIGKSNTNEKIRIYDTMTTIGINISIPYPSRKNKEKTAGIGKKIYKWTKKGGK